MVVSAPPPSPCFTVSVVKTADGSLEAFFVNFIFCIHHDWHTQGSFCVKSGQISSIFSMVKEGKVIEVPFILRGHITSSINNQSITKMLIYRFLHCLSCFTCRVWPWRIVRKWATVHLSILTLAAVLRKKEAPGGALGQRPRPALTFSPGDFRKNSIYNRVLRVLQP